MAERVTQSDWAAYDQMNQFDNARTRAFGGVDYFNDANQAQSYANARNSMLDGLLGRGAQAATPFSGGWDSFYSSGGQPAPAPTAPAVPSYDWGAWAGPQSAPAPAPAPGPDTYTTGGSFGGGTTFSTQPNGPWGDGLDGFTNGGWDSYDFGATPGAIPGDMFSPNATPGATGFGDRIMSPHGFNTPWGDPNYANVPTPTARPPDLMSPAAAPQPANVPMPTPRPPDLMAPVVAAPAVAAPAAGGGGNPTGMDWGQVMGSFNQMDALLAQTMQAGYYGQPAGLLGFGGADDGWGGGYSGGNSPGDAFSGGGGAPGAPAGTAGNFGGIAGGGWGGSDQYR